MNSRKTDIQNALLDLVGKFTEFHPVVYVPATGVASVDDAAERQPTTKLVNEILSGFSEDKSYGRQVRRIRSEWSYQMILEWDQGEIWLEAFEDSVINPFVLIPAAADGSYSQVIAWLRSSIPQHPPQQSPSTGTKATLVFDVQVTRN